MALVPFEIQSSDGTTQNAVLDTITGQTYAAQLFKWGFGTPGNLTLVSADDPLPVSIDSLNVTLDVTGDHADLDSGAGTDNHEVFAIGLPGAGGHVIGGTATNPLRTDPTGATTQPISAALLPLPAGASTSVNQSTIIAGLASIDAKDFATQTTLAAVLAKIIDAPATEAKQDTLIAKDFATQTTLASLLTELQGKADLAETQPVSLATLPAGTNVIGKVDHSTGSIGDGRKEVASAGTAEALATSTACKWVIVVAETDNTGTIVVGGSTVVAALGTRRGTPLIAGQAVTLQIDNLADVFIDSTVNGDGVTFTYGAA